MRSVRKSGRRVAASESAARRECPFSAPRPGRETGRVDVTDLDGDPLRQLSLWLDAARAAGQPMPEAMTIATATSDGVPSARLVVLRGLRRGLVFFTDCESEKGADLAANPRAAAVLHWLVPVAAGKSAFFSPGWLRSPANATGHRKLQRSLAGLGPNSRG